MAERRAKRGLAPGLASRAVACHAVAEVLGERIALEEALEREGARQPLSGDDTALARAIATATFRRFGTIRAALTRRLDRGLPADPRVLALLATGAAQILFLDIPDHAAVDTSVRLARGDPRLTHVAALTNAVLRRLARDRDAILTEGASPLLDTPEWLAQRWSAAYGAVAADAIAEAHRAGPSVDLSVKQDAAGWAERLGGLVLPTGSVRLVGRGSIRDLPGFTEGAWWVQDAASALPARLLAVGSGERVLDLCAAPGGKTAQFAAAGAAVTALDRSGRRLERLAANLRRLELTAEIVEADAMTFEAAPFDAVLLDAPCSATGTIRRHPDAAWAKRPADIAALAQAQGRLLDHAAGLVRPGGRLVFCTCSLEPEEGERQAEAFLARQPGFRRRPIRAEEVGGLGEVLNSDGDLRSLPCHLADVPGARPGLDGFFATRLERLR